MQSRKNNLCSPRALVLTTMAVLLITPVLPAEVVRVEVTSREVVSERPEHGRVGPYEVITGTLHLEVDPEHPANHRIIDLALAEPNARGRVELSTEFELHLPVDPTHGNRRLLYFVNNRGNKMARGHFDSHNQGGTWLYSQGFSLLWCGWNVDVVDRDDRLNIRVPVVPVTGKVYAEMISFANQLVPSRSIVWGGSLAPPPVDMEAPDATLTMRRYRWEEPVVVPRETWSFARQDNGEIVPDPGSVYITDGFKPGWLYDLVYTAKGSRIAGLGLAAIRDVVSFFRYHTGATNPLADLVDHAYAWGHSQSGRLLNHFVYEDFNGDERGRLVLDGVIANCPGAGRGQFNSRFAQATRHGSHHEDNLYPIDVFPFTTVTQTDPVTGARGDALARARASGFLPKIFVVNSSTDYWTRAASLLHTDVTGTHDAAIDPAVRIYMVAGRAHTSDRVGIIGKALLVAMDQWVSNGVKPPRSQVPRIDDGTLVTLDVFREKFPAIEGVRPPPSFYQPYRLDLGARWESDGIADNVPPKTGAQYVALVPQVDEDGNEVAGVRLPEVAVPLASFTGWSMRSPSFSDTLRRNGGAIWPLSRTSEERQAGEDSRRSVEERYQSAADFLAQVVDCLLELRRERLLLDEDLAMLLGQAQQQAALFPRLPRIEEVAADDDAEAGMEHLQKMRTIGLEWLIGSSAGEVFNRVNLAGYQLMQAKQPARALQVFRLNTMLFPEEWNVWDSLGECHMAMGDLKLSRECYQRSLELNPANDNAVQMIESMSKEPSGS